MFVFPHLCYVPAFLLCGTTKGSSLDLHHRRHRLVYWTVRDPLCHRLKILLGRCFTSAFSRPPHSSCGRLHGGIPTFRPNSEDKPQARTRSTPYGSLLSQLPANQNSRNAAGLHGLVDGKSYILNLLPAPLRGVTHIHPGVVGGCCVRVCFVLGLHCQHVHALRVGERPV